MSDKPKKPKCTGRRADGRPCSAAPLDGTTRCWHHSFKVPGRPSKLTPELQERILDAILEGVYMETAAQAVGINKTTLYRWIERGETAEQNALAQAEEHDAGDELSGEELYEYANPADWPYMDFRHALKSAEAFGEIELVRKVTRGHGEQPWTAYMTVLERRFAERWRRRDKITHDGIGDLSKPRTSEPADETARRTTAAILVAAAGEHLEDIAEGGDGDD